MRGSLLHKYVPLVWTHALTVILAICEHPLNHDYTYNFYSGQFHAILILQVCDYN